MSHSIRWTLCSACVCVSSLWSTSQTSQIKLMKKWEILKKKEENNDDEVKKEQKSEKNKRMKSVQRGGQEPGCPPRSVCAGGKT